MRKQAFCICKNKDADKLRGNREADQRLCFRFTDSIKKNLFFLNMKFQASETPKTGFLTSRLIYYLMCSFISKCCSFLSLLDKMLRILLAIFCVGCAYSADTAGYSLG